jgi:methionyl-tRNA synthetase
MQGNQALFIAGDDAHGTPIMISAQKQGITPEALVQGIQLEHQADLSDFLVKFDNYHTTHSEENKTLSYVFYQRLKARGDISSRVITQAYDPVANLFLPDRYIRGECPRCGAKDQYGDSCEVCGSTYSPMDLKNPISVVSGVAPIEKDSEHFFFNLERYADFLKQWIQEGHVPREVANKLEEWFAEGLKPWDISRDAPYFGFEIPDQPGKYFYVWLDAPVGYLASLAHYVASHPEVTLEQFWGKESTTEVHHFIGKDIVYFHALFWPAMLEGAGFRTPTQLHVHGYLTINGQKMSKSRGTFITARDYLNRLHPDYLRYYFACKLSSQVEDIDLNLQDFMLRVNSDLVGKFVNLASRCAGFITRSFNGQLADHLHQEVLWQETMAASDGIAEAYGNLHYSKAMREIMLWVDRANQYIDHEKPWSRIKTEGPTAEIQAICTQGINLFRLFSIWLKPVLPDTLEKIEAFLQVPPLTWADAKQPLLNHVIAPFSPLMQRIVPETIALFSA